jgi:Zn finger protein HypA/HybF involved in hydrogenase expression
MADQNQGASIEAERAAFEASGIVGRLWRNNTPGSTEYYEDSHTQIAWRAWQESAARRSVPPAAGEDELPPLDDAVIAGIMGWRGPGAYTAATLRKIREVIAADRAQRKQATPPATGATEDLPPLPQDDCAVHIYPSDLARMERTETTATVFSVAVGCPGEESVPLYTAEQYQQGQREAIAHYLRKQAGQVGAYTCIGKGGSYELVGVSKGAGTMRDVLICDLTVYRDTASGQLYHRAPDDFAARMEPVAPETRSDAALQEMIDIGQAIAQPALKCWSCAKSYTLELRAEADGNCPHCGAEIELDGQEGEQPTKGESA